MRIAVITIASRDRFDRVERQRQALALAGGEDDVVPLLVDLADPALSAEDTGRVHLAAARNLGASRAMAAGAELLVFLDADCLPGPDCLSLYAEAALHRPDALLAGPVTYLTEDESRGSLEEMLSCRHPHAARPDPEPGVLEVIPASEERRGDYNLFWSLSFAVTPGTWERIGGFSEAYRGYGGEDTDFAYLALQAGVDLVWVGGADAVHQWHPVSSPPVEHLEEILENAAVFFRRWGRWPMVGWLEAFEERGLARRDEQGRWRLAELD